MASYTPQFDKALDEILKDLKPHSRKCAWFELSPYCKENFEITEDDIEFYGKLRVSPPTLCPECRRQRRLIFSNIIKLHKRECDAPEHSEKMISFVSPIKDFSVYDLKFYRSDDWDPLSYGETYDTSQPFFDSYYEKMRRVVPQPAIIRDPSCVNSEYTLNGRNLKNGYYVSGGWNSEDISYSIMVSKSNDCLDCFTVINVHSCYENVFTRNCYSCDYVYFSNDCLNSAFMYDCRNCHDCFGCVNLRNKKHCFFNEQLSKEEYDKKRAEIYLGDRKTLAKYREKFLDLIKESPIRASRIEKSINVSGNQIIECKNCINVINAEKSENIRFAESTIGNKDSMDYAISGGSELLYETIAVGSRCSKVKFTFASKFIIESEYLINCRNCSNCFACIGLDNKQFCIFNKQYKEDEYWSLVDEIKLVLLEREEYGEFFPLKFSTFAYNDSMAQIVFPLTKEQVEKLGALWQEDTDIDVGDMDTIPARETPDDIKDVTDEIMNKALIGEDTGRPFRIIPSELEFYRRKQLPIPIKHPYKRMIDRYLWVNNFRITEDTCQKCGKEIYTSYESKEGFQPYCEECYVKEVV